MLSLRATIACTALAACAGNPARSYAAPAPAGALDCSLRTMAGVGYTPVAGGVRDGYIKFDKRDGAGFGRSMATAIPGVGAPRVGDFVTVTEAGTQLRINVVGYKADGSATKPGDEAMGHAQAIISGCANPATNQVPGRTDG